MNRDMVPTLVCGWRGQLVLAVLTLAAVFLAWRAVDLQVVDRAFLQSQGDMRHMRVVSDPAHRGMITDRHGDPLAISTPVSSVWANPQQLPRDHPQLPELAGLLEAEPATLRAYIEQRGDREFVYLRRHVGPETAQQVMGLELPGVALQREYRRYYPAGEVAVHVLGFSDIDDRGQEGVELAFDDWLRGEPGAKRVIRDRLGRVVENVEQIRETRPGRDLRLSIDRRLQYFAYRQLKAAVNQHQARAGSAVVLDVTTGEILAMVSQPSFNPNDRRGLNGDRSRNRAVVDVFEPGSVIKPFTVAAALEAGVLHPDTRVDTSPGQLRVGSSTIRDIRDYGVLDVGRVISKSSNVGASKIALAMESPDLWRTFQALGFGESTASGFPGEASGTLPHHLDWRELRQATLAFGYGLSITPLQLASAYATLANDGLRRPLSLLRRDDVPAGEQIMTPEVARQVRDMLESVVATDGTGRLARVPGYRVAGKTGTVRKSTRGGYTEERYTAVFAGMAPASRPRLAMVVIVDEPDGGEYYGGQVAAPVFAEVMAGALRLLNIPPDDLSEPGRHLAVQRLEDPS